MGRSDRSAIISPQQAPAAEPADATLNTSIRGASHHHHHASIGEKIAHEHEVRRATGRESSQALVAAPLSRTAGSASQSAVSNDPGTQLHEHILSLLSTTNKKNKGEVTDDAELAEFMRQHPELSQYIKELKQARDEALRNAESKQQSPLQSKDNLLAKLDVIATLLEGAPIAPALRMGDTAAKEAFVQASKKEFGGDEGAALAEYTWNKARQAALEKAEAEAKTIAAVSAELLARDESPSAEEKQAAQTERTAFETRVREQFEPRSAQHILATLSEHEDRERGRLVSERAWELQVRARVLEERYGEEAAKRDLDDYLAAQSDLLDRSPEFKRALDAHLSEARNEGRRLRLSCDHAARELFRACDGWGTYEDVIFSNLEGRSQYELRIIRERYQEMYGEHLRDRLESELSGSDHARAMNAYNGDVNNRGFGGRAIASAGMDAVFGAENQAIRQAVISGGDAQQAAVQMQHALRTSSVPATAMLEIIRDTGVTAESLAIAEASLGLDSSLAALKARVPAQETGEPSITAQRDECGARLVEAALKGEPIADESYAQYGALESAHYGLQMGSLEARERPDAELAEELREQHTKFRASIASFCGRYEGLSEKLDSAAEEFRVYARSNGASVVARSYGEKLGMLYGHDNDAVKHRLVELEQQYARYISSQQSLIDAHPELQEKLLAAKESGIRCGLDSMENVRKAVSQLNSAIDGLGTAEAKCYAALQGKSTVELRLIKQLYKGRFGETLELSVEGDFSYAELDKMHALLIVDHIGVAAADAQMAMSGFWGVDQESLRTTLRSLQSIEDRKEFKTRFDQKYADDFYKRSATEGDPPLQAKDFEQALEFTMAGDNLIAAQSLFEGDFNRADAALVHADLDGFWGPDGEAAALRLEAMKKANGHLDSERIDAVAVAYQKQYNSALRGDAGAVDGAEGKWLVSVVDGDEIDAAAHKLRYAMGGSVDGTDEKLVRQPFALPEALAQQVAYEERHGGLSEETRTQLTEWSDFRRSVVQRYSEQDMYPGHDVIVDLRDELNDHHFRMVKTLINDGKLSKADLIADACAGGGTDEATLYRETSGLSKADATKLAEDFSRSGYGKLEAVLESELSGDERFDILENVRGLPETAQEMREYAIRRYKHEDSGICSGLVWGAERGQMIDDLDRLKKAIESGGDAHEVDALYRRFGVSASAFRDQKNQVSDVIVNTSTTVIMVGGTVVMIVGSGGTATPGAVALWSIYLAGTAGVVRTGTKWAIRGEGYGNEELAVDGGIMLVDMATAVVVAKIPVGRMVGGRLEVMLGEIAAQRGAAVVAEDGTKLTGEALFRYLTQSSRGLRVVVGATQGAVDGAMFAPIQSASITALQDSTWDRGFGQGLARMGESGLAAIPGGLATGTVFGGAAAFRTPAFIKNGQPLSTKEASALTSEGRISEAGRELLLEREAAKGFITRGDVADAHAAGTKIGTERSAELIAQLRNTSDARFGEGDIRLFEAKVKAQGSLSKFDENLILNDPSNRYVAAISEQDVQKRVVETRRQINDLQLRSEVRGIDAGQREVLQQGLSHAGDRLMALEDTLRHIAAAKASHAPDAVAETLIPVAAPESNHEAAQAKRERSAQIENPGDAALNDQVRAQEEFVARLERDLADPSRVKFRDVIEESLVDHRARLSDLRDKAFAARQAQVAEPDMPSSHAEGSNGSAGDDSNPWHYDPSESFAKELEAQARGDYDEPLDNGLGGREPFRGDAGPVYDSSGGGPQLQRAPQRQKTRVMVMELPEPAIKPAQPRSMLADDIGVAASRQELDLGEAIIREAIATPAPEVQPQLQPQAVATLKPKPKTQVQTAPSIEEILAPQFDQPLFQPAPQAAPHMQPQLQAVTPGLALGRLTKLDTKLQTAPIESLQRVPQPEAVRPMPTVMPKLVVEELLKRPATKRKSNGGSGVEGEEDVRPEEAHIRNQIESKRHKLEMARSEKKGGAKLRFSKVIDVLGDENLVIDDEEAGQA